MAPPRQRSLFGDDPEPLTVAFRGAVFAPTDMPNQPYRLRLVREWGDPASRCMFLMLNPSVADANIDDRTVRRCMDFAWRWGFGALEVANIFALRGTDRRVLLSHADPVGPGNDAAILDAAALVRTRRGLRGRIVCAWGEWGAIRDRQTRVHELLRLVSRFEDAPEIVCLRRNNDGSPAHPLYVPSSITPVPYDVAR